MVLILLIRYVVLSPELTCKIWFYWGVKGKPTAFKKLFNTPVGTWFVNSVFLDAGNCWNLCSCILLSSRLLESSLSIHIFKYCPRIWSSYMQSLEFPLYGFFLSRSFLQFPATLVALRSNFFLFSPFLFEL